MKIPFSPFRRRWPPAATALFCLLAQPAAAQEWRPVEGAEGWLLSTSLPGVEQRVCTVRNAGPEASTTLLINGAGVPVLMLGRPDWNNGGGEVRTNVSIDGASPVALQARPAGNLVLVLLSDRAVLGRLRVARILQWTFPFGRFRTNVTGLGAALDALRACHDATPRET
jgi:hypothetical protein